MTTVRPAIESDRLTLFKLCIAMVDETDFANYNIAPQKMIDALGFWIASPDADALVAERNGELVGLMLVKLARPWFSDDLSAVEDLFYVLPEHRGSRAGFKLVQALKRWAVERGAVHIRAGVSSGKGEAGGRLYEHFGMKLMGGNYIAHLKD